MTTASALPRRTAILVLPALLAAGVTLTGAPASAVTASSVDARTCTGSVNGNTIRLALTVTFTGSQSDDVSRITARATDLAESGTFRNSRVDATSLRISLYTAAQRTTVNKYSTRTPFTVYTDPSTRSSGKDALSATAYALYTSGGKSARLSCSVMTF